MISYLSISYLNDIGTVPSDSVHYVSGAAVYPALDVQLDFLKAAGSGLGAGPGKVRRNNKLAAVLDFEKS